MENVFYCDNSAPTAVFPPARPPVTPTSTTPSARTSRAAWSKRRPWPTRTCVCVCVCACACVCVRVCVCARARVCYELLRMVHAAGTLSHQGPAASLSVSHTKVFRLAESEHQAQSRRGPAYHLTHTGYAPVKISRNLRRRCSTQSSPR